MEEARGIITREELEAYGGADIMLLDGASDSTGSGNFASGQGNYSWAIRWTENGFTDVTWSVPDWTKWEDKFKAEYKSGTLKSFLEAEENLELSQGVFNRIRMTGDTFFGCTDYELLS